MVREKTGGREETKSASEHTHTHHSLAQEKRESKSKKEGCGDWPVLRIFRIVETMAPTPSRLGRWSGYGPGLGHDYGCLQTALRMALQISLDGHYLCRAPCPHP